MTGIIVANGENGHRFVLSVHSKTPYGDLRLEFKFELSWAVGSIQLLSSEKRFTEFENTVSGLRTGSGLSFEFLNEEGNLEIKICPRSSGDSSIEVIAIPDMTQDDRIEFALEGFIRIDPEGLRNCAP